MDDYLKFRLECKEHLDIVKGPKILDLDPIEIMEIEKRIKRIKMLLEAKRIVQLDIDEISIGLKKWWVEIRKKHKIDAENITYDEGAIYEGRIEDR